MEGDNFQENSTATEQSEGEILTDKRSVKEKVISGAVLLVVVVAVFVAYYQMMSSLTGPIKRVNEYAKENSGCYGGDCQDEGDDILTALQRQTKDTDKDGLSDYDELTLYGTSPYLEDSDGDGMSDYVEVEAGYDPNCPGEYCEDSASADLDSGFGTTQTDQNISLTPDYLRQLFVESGVPAEEVEALTDEEVMDIYNRASAEYGDGSGPSYDYSQVDMPSDVSFSDLGVGSVEELTVMSGAEIRQLMIDSGAPSEALAEVSDEELKEMFMSELEKQISQNQ